MKGGLETALENSIVVDGSMMNQVIKVDKYNMQVTCQCGVPLQELDDMLREQGYTTGHSPQSKPLAQMGGLVATRSIGQFSTLYGGIEDMIVGLEAVFPNGEICRIKNIPRRAAGPDIRHIIVGNEGALCYITEVTVKLFKYQPENNVFLGYKINDMKRGFDALRAVMAEGYKPSIARLYDAADASLHFDWAGEDNVLIFMAEGPAAITKATAEGIRGIIQSQFSECEQVEPMIISKWFDGLNWGPEQIAEEKIEILATKNIGITTEVSGCWDCIYDIYKTACDRIIAEVPDMTLMGGHSSHSYINGTNMYFVYYYNIVDCAPEEEINKYHNRINQIICEQVIKFGGSIVHHHGLGKARAKYVWEEYGSSFYMLETLKKAFDPNGIMNMGTLIPLKK
ncbi:MAG: FAD-binding oxidoreductase [Lachnospiraceae bacterium]